MKPNIIESHENEFLQKTSLFYKLQCTVCVHYRVLYSVQYTVLHSTYWTVYSKLLVPWTSVIALFATDNTSWRHLLAPLQSLQYTLHYIKFKCISHPKYIVPCSVIYRFHETCRIYVSFIELLYILAIHNF